MKSLFVRSDNQEMIDRLNSLSPSSRAKWGKMNVVQMFGHCQAAISLAFGDVQLKQNFIGIFFSPIARLLIVNSKIPFRKNLPTDRSFVINDVREFEKEKNILISTIQKFSEVGSGKLSKHKHPFFGTLSKTEWDRLTWKHLDHHLRQFGA